jgi:hypothetical protein
VGIDDDQVPLLHQGILWIQGNGVVGQVCLSKILFWGRQHKHVLGHCADALVAPCLLAVVALLLKVSEYPRGSLPLQHLILNGVAEGNQRGFEIQLWAQVRQSLQQIAQ